ncbi:hypothetical protein [Chroococcidiopsis cubana]|uniref:hypothetical protein n=1 Tax=Chroococcidiopsis cubana TaxID=171392 RepID=UPI002ACDC68D|nr:hypothetical protein [Chroococcidiopsis cubana]
MRGFCGDRHLRSKALSSLYDIAVQYLSIQLLETASQLSCKIMSAWRRSAARSFHFGCNAQ